MKSKWKLGPNALWLVLAMLCCLPAYAQDIQATGTVTDSNDEPLIGVTIMVKLNMQRRYNTINKIFNIVLEWYK